MCYRINSNAGNDQYELYNTWKLSYNKIAMKIQKYFSHAKYLKQTARFKL